jgi:hypothetical protein
VSKNSLLLCSYSEKGVWRDGKREGEENGEKKEKDSQERVSPEEPAGFPNLSSNCQRQYSRIGL